MNHKRENLSEAGYCFIHLDEEKLVVQDVMTARKELFIRNDGAACWTLRFEGGDYEFVRGL